MKEIPNRFRNGMYLKSDIKECVNEKGITMKTAQYTSDTSIVFGDNGKPYWGQCLITAILGVLDGKEYRWNSELICPPGDVSYGECDIWTDGYGMPLDRNKMCYKKEIHDRCKRCYGEPVIKELVYKNTTFSKLKNHIMTWVYIPYKENIEDTANNFIYRELCKICPEDHDFLTGKVYKKIYKNRIRMDKIPKTVKVKTDYGMIDMSLSQAQISEICMKKQREELEKKVYHYTFITSQGKFYIKINGPLYKKCLETPIPISEIHTDMQPLAKQYSITHVGIIDSRFGKILYLNIPGSSIRPEYVLTRVS